uniref:Dynein heavy chain 17, axonemal n=1 Tax=Sphaerodactylus townsendi TaxID=933632 RepID=A0ACB8EKG7_9SAUR
MATDKRLDFIEKYCYLSLRMKPDKWSKFATSEEVLAMLNEFYEKQDLMVLVITLNPTGQLVPCIGFPSVLKNKAVYFVKRKHENITKDNIQNAVLVGDLSPSPVEQMMAVVEEVVYSLFLRSENLAGWPQVVAEDVIRQAHRLKNEMFVMGGKIKGKTLLPLPERVDMLYTATDMFDGLSASVDSTLLHSIETIIIDWSHQIRDILSKDSAQPLLDGLNPLPKVEFDFWYSRQVNLQCINEQLYTPQVQKIAEILERANSCYWPALRNVFKDVSAGLKEADDINLYLQPLKVLLEEMEQAEYPQPLFHSLWTEPVLPYSLTCSLAPYEGWFRELQYLLPPFINSVMYTVCLIWANSEYYNTPSRVIVILQEICNLIIEMTRNFLSPEEVLKGLQSEIEEFLSGIKLGISVIEKLYQTYDVCCSDMMPSFFQDKEPQYWEFPSTLVFARMNAFFHRLKTIEELYVTSIEFLKLEKIELGGVRGNILGSQVVQIYEEVIEFIKVFAECKYDPLDPADEQFDEDFADFQIKIQDLDRRLATIFYQGFVDSSSIESAVKHIHMFATLLERPLIKADAAAHYSKLLEMFNVKLDNVKILYDVQIANKAKDGVPPISKNMPPVAGQLKWALELQERLQIPMKDLQAIDHPVMASSEAKLIYAKYEEMIRLLKGYREKIYEEWISHVDRDCQFNLEQPLILRDPHTKYISVNFNKELVAVLREVKYLNFQQQKEIPGSAGGLFSQNETFRKFVDNLDLIVGWYNKIKQTILNVELPLIKDELQEIDVGLQKAETKLFWSNEGVMDYIQEMRDVLYDLETRIQKTKLNVENIGQLMQEWSASPLFERKDNKDTALLDLDGKAHTITKRYAAIKDAGQKIQAMVEENAELFKAAKTSGMWKKYVEYIDDMILDGYFKFIRKSLQFLLSNMSADVHIAPLFEVRMELYNDDLRYRPSLEIGADQGFLEVVENLMNDIYETATLIPRLAKGKHSYRNDLEDMGDLLEMREEVVTQVINAMKQGEEFEDSFEKYAYLWMDDPHEFMQRFLTFGHALTTEELESHAEEYLPHVAPTLDQFQLQIDTYEKLYDDVSKFENTKVFNGWLQSDCRPFKQALLNIIKRWSLMFKQHLINHVTNR